MCLMYMTIRRMNWDGYGTDVNHLCSETFGDDIQSQNNCKELDMAVQSHAQALLETEKMLKDLSERRSTLQDQMQDTLMLDTMALILKNQLTIMRMND